MVGLKENKGREKRKREGDVFYSSMMPALLSMLASIDFRYTTIATKVRRQRSRCCCSNCQEDGGQSIHGEEHMPN